LVCVTVDQSEGLSKFQLIQSYQCCCALIICFILNLALFPSKLLSGPATDRLSVCIVEHTSQEDIISLVRWIFIAVAAHPDVNDLSDFSDIAETKADVEVARIFQKLMTKDCVEEVKTALIIDGDVAIEASFTILGKVATESLMDNQNVIERTQGFIPYVDPKSFDIFN